MAVRRYAEGTKVDIATSKADIERLVTKHGASGFMTAWEDNDKGIGHSLVMFRLRGRMLKYVVEKPDPSKIRSTRGRKPKTPKAEAEHRRRWRALFLIIRAKLEMVMMSDDPGAFDREFMANILLPNNQTVGDAIVPKIIEAYETGNLPKLLPSGF